MTLGATPLAAVLEAFRSPAPTPGGGSAAALAGAIGAALLAMVAALPKPKAATEEELRRLQEVGARCTVLSTQLEALVDRDSEAYEQVVAAYKLPKATDEEKTTRATHIQQALAAAIEAPLDVMRAAAQALAAGPVLVALGNPNASSDVQVGLELLRAARRGAQLNIEINLSSVKDAAYAARVSGEVARLVSESA
jgi:methenyltetrahydrofolate cyclohydrolase